jgi:hypothetical protein
MVLQFAVAYLLLRPVMVSEYMLSLLMHFSGLPRVQVERKEKGVVVRLIVVKEGQKIPVLKDRKTSNPEETDNVTTEANLMVRVLFMNFGHNCLHHRTTPLDRMVNETM